MDRRRKAKQEVRFRILDAAREIFSGGGEEAVTLRRVAERIEYSATTIYLHFRDKNDLLSELCLNDFATHSRIFRQAERETDAVLRLRKVASVYVDFALQNPALYRLMFSHLPPRSNLTEETTVAHSDRKVPDRASSSASETLSTPYSFLYSAVFKAMAAGYFLPEYQDVAIITQMLWGGLHGVVSLHAVRARYPEISWKPATATTGAMIECLLDGLRGRPRHD